MANCLLTGESLPQVNTYLSGYECREKNKECCPNYMRNTVHGRNCRLLQDNERKYARCCLRSTLEPFKEKYKNKDTLELNALYKELEEKFLDCVDPERRTTLRAQLGAIEEILLERRIG